MKESRASATARPSVVSAFTAPAAWSALGQAHGLAELLGPWLELLCAEIGDVSLACARLDANLQARPFDTEGAIAAPLQATWPRDADASALLAAIHLAEERGRGLLDEDKERAAHYTLAYPVQVGDETLGAVALRAGPFAKDRVQLAMRQLQWGLAWLRADIALDRLNAAQSGGLVERAVLESLAIALETPGLEASARAVATDLAHRLECERVSIGLVRRNRSEVVAISHSAQFGQDMNLIRQIAAAMDEALDQKTAILFPPDRASWLASRAHQALAQSHGSGQIVTAPLFLHGAFIGALTLERERDRPFETRELALLDLMASALAPAMEEKRLNDRPLPVKARDALWSQLRTLVGPAHAGRKLSVLAIGAAALLFAVWTDTYRITADAQVEGREQRAIVVAYNGFLREAPARAGDKVKQGDLLAALDDRDLTLEKLKWTTERQRHAFEYEKAMGDRNRADQRIYQNQVEQADAQIRLIDEQLARARMTAPFDGIVVSGDHSQSIGASVQRGQTLFEVAPATGHRVILSVDEADIADMRIGQIGGLVAAALPSENFPIEIVRLTPVAANQEGRNVFRVEARPTQETEPLRPGMRGAAKIEIDRRRVIWIWTHGLMNWVRLNLWRWEG